MNVGILKNKYIILTFAGILLSGQVLCNGWVSSGGDLVKDQNNPWWIANTPKVPYCIAHDSESFSASIETVTTMVQKAIQYWKDSFQHNTIVFEHDFHFKLATQDFQLVECSQSPPLIFKLGYGTLDPDEKQYIGEQFHHIGLAIRKEYDRKLLRSKGVIYLSSDQGPHQYADAQSVKQAWKYEGLLYRILLHELGHVFGLTHDQEIGWQKMKSSQIMAANLAEHILAERYHRFYQSDLNLPLFGAKEPIFSTCTPDTMLKSVLGATDHAECISWEQDTDGMIQVFQTEQQERTKLGDVHLISPVTKFVFKPLVSLYLTKEQQVIHPDPNYPQQQNVPQRIYGPLGLESDLKFEFRNSQSGHQSKLMIGFHRSHFKIFALHSGEIERIY